MSKYQNISDQVQVIPTVGVVKPKEIIEVPDDKPIENPNFELVKNKKLTGIEAMPETPKE